MIILGAGMSGCIAGIINGTARIFEGGDAPYSDHMAVLRFRNESVSKAVGIPFQQVRVSKSIWFNHQEVQPSPRFTNLYSRKITGKCLDRSISVVKDEMRYIAPHDFHEQMRAMLGSKVHYGEIVEDILPTGIVTQGGIHHRDDAEPVISTLPILAIAKMVEMKVPSGSHEIRSILVSQFEIEDCDVFATVYYPDPDFPVYRASLAGNRLIVECVDRLSTGYLAEVVESMGLGGQVCNLIFDNRKQNSGKIVPTNDSERREFIYQLTQQHNIYSLGRFAIWKNVLLDDVVNDVYMINRMITKDNYALRRGR